MRKKASEDGRRPAAINRRWARVVEKLHLRQNGLKRQGAHGERSVPVGAINRDHSFKA
jgi:hypothetical protein